MLPGFCSTKCTVAYMHRNIVAHRDLKLESSLLNKNWVPKLADFRYVSAHTCSKIAQQTINQNFFLFIKHCLINNYQAISFFQINDFVAFLVLLLYGMPSHWDGHTPCRQWCGSLPYFSPELLKNDPYNPLQSDIWSEAVCLYTMTNDTFPFKHGDDTLMLQNQLEQKWKLRGRTEKKYASSYKDLLTKMLDPDPQRRYSAEKVSSHQWIVIKPING